MELKLGDKVVSTYGTLEAEVVAILPRPSPSGYTVVLQSPAAGEVYFSTKAGYGPFRFGWKKKKPVTKTLYCLTLLDPNNTPTVWTYPDQKTREKTAALYCDNLYWKVVDSFERTIEIEE